MIALTAELIGSITGLRPPLERHLFPPLWLPAINRFIDGAKQVIRESSTYSPVRHDGGCLYCNADQGEIHHKECPSRKVIAS